MSRESHSRKPGADRRIHLPDQLRPHRRPNGGGQRAQHETVDGGELSCNPVMAPEVGPVGEGLVVDLENHVTVDLEDVLDLDGLESELMRQFARARASREVDEVAEPFQGNLHNEPLTRTG